MKKILVFCAMVLAFSCGARQQPKGYEFPDEQFLYWCESVDREWPVYLEYPVGCETKVSRGRWDHFPIVVYADESLVPEMAEAIKVFNRQVGFNLFELDVIGAEMPDVLAFVAGFHPFAAAEAKHLTVEGRHHGAVIVYNGIEDDNRADIMMHELGHIVGLRHDESHLSIMYTGGRSRAAMLEPDDIRALRWIYKQR